MAKTTVLYLNHTDLELKEKELWQNFEGRMARKEIKRRKDVGYCDGTAIERVDPMAKFEEPESKVGQITINGVIQ